MASPRITNNNQLFLSPVKKTATTCVNGTETNTASAKLPANYFFSAPGAPARKKSSPPKGQGIMNKRELFPTF